MPNEPGEPIWYELITSDPDGATRFYGEVMGWTIERETGAAADYRMIAARDGGLAGGVLRMDEPMRAAGAEAGWLFYLAVADVDATAEQARALGGAVHVPPRDIPDVGRFSLLADPEGAAFYVMRSVDGQSSTAFSGSADGRCGWNELWTTDVGNALAFYGALFGWENRDTDRGPQGEYHFLDRGDLRLGAAAEMKDARPRWNFYFNAPDLGAALVRVRDGGGAVDMGPYQVPTGKHIAICRDPEGVRFSLVSGTAGRAGVA